MPKTLLEKCQDGDVVAFEELCAVLQPDLYAFVYAYLRDHDLSDEAVQETLLRVYRNLDALESTGAFASWIMKIAINQCHTISARAARRDTGGRAEEFNFDEALGLEFVGQAAASPLPRTTSESAEIRRDVAAALQRLPERQRTAIVLFEVEGLAVKDVAAVMECNAGTVKFHLHEARKRLREFLAVHRPVGSEGSQ